MDTPEGDVYAIQSGTMEPLPVYVEEEPALSGLQALIAALPPPPSYPLDPLDRDTVGAFLESQTTAQPGPKSAGPPEPIMEYPRLACGQQVNEVMRIQQAIVTGFFDAISKSQEEAIALFINNNLVTANTTNERKKTPLLAAIATKNVAIVQELLNFGADPNAFGVLSQEFNYYSNYNSVIERTPLQLAASIGHLPLVKLLMEVYHADDSLVANDGQIALRLAAENGHRQVVDYLPVRRGGGFRRWQHHHQKAVRRIKRAAEQIYCICKFFVWDIEKFLLWSVPKHLIIKPIAKGCTWCWKNRHLFRPWLQLQLSLMPERSRRLRMRVSKAVTDVSKGVWKAVKVVPKAVVDVSKGVWTFGTKTLPKVVADVSKELWTFVTKRLPKMIKEFALWCWNVFTRRIPTAIAIAAKWIWDGLSSMGRAILEVILKFASLLHTVFEAVITFFRNLTVADIWNGFCNLLHTIFVGFPKTLWSWILKFSDASFNIMKTMFGNIGEILWWIVVGIGWLVTFVPRKCGVILQSIGSSFAKGFHEIVVFIKPKA